MKTAIKAALATFGLAPVAHVKRLTADAQRAAGKVVQLEERLAHVRADADKWKRRYEDTAEATAGWKQAASRAQGDAERAKAAVERAHSDVKHAKADTDLERARAEEWKGRAGTLSEEVQELRGKLQDARVRMNSSEQAATSAREHLMAMEVKLDLIESAIQVLDARTREQAVTPPSAVAADV